MQNKIRKVKTTLMAKKLNGNLGEKEYLKSKPWQTRKNLMIGESECGIKVGHYFGVNVVDFPIQIIACVLNFFLLVLFQEYEFLSRSFPCFRCVLAEGARPFLPFQKMVEKWWINLAL